MPDDIRVRVRSGSARVVASTVGPRGPAGAAGPSGDTPTVTAQGALSAERLVTASGEYVDPNTDSVYRVAGVTLGAAADGEDVPIARAGIFPTGTWSDGPVWCGTAGALVQALPTTRFVLRVGLADGGDLTLDIQPPIDTGS